MNYTLFWASYVTDEEIHEYVDIILEQLRSKKRKENE